MKRRFRIGIVALVAGGALGLTPAAVATPPPGMMAVDCSNTWHVITHGETGLNVRPDPYMHQGSTDLQVDGIPGDDYWNQQFLFCRDPGWGPDHYGIYSNLTGRYWAVDGDAAGVYAGWPAIESRHQLFEVRRIDPTWWTIRYVGNPFFLNMYVHPLISPLWGNPLQANNGPLTGNHLFRISPPDLLA